MVVKRIVPNIATTEVGKARAFYADFLGLELAMDLGWIATYTASGSMPPQVSVLSEGGSGTTVPDISIEVDDLDEALRRARALGLPIEYGPRSEPWGVRRFYVRDPFGRLVNILVHDDREP
jgi:catechol 2,3-dioxygenase-like lactoylglutathione lyase family enzyme